MSLPCSHSSTSSSPVPPRGTVGLPTPSRLHAHRAHARKYALAAASGSHARLHRKGAASLGLPAESRRARQRPTASPTPTPVAHNSLHARRAGRARHLGRRRHHQWVARHVQAQPLGGRPAARRQAGLSAGSHPGARSSHAGGQASCRARTRLQAAKRSCKLVIQSWSTARTALQCFRPKHAHPLKQRCRTARPPAHNRLTTCIACVAKTPLAHRR